MLVRRLSSALPRVAAGQLWQTTASPDAADQLRALLPAEPGRSLVNRSSSTARIRGWCNHVQDRIPVADWPLGVMDMARRDSLS
jgi:hypothetical protein